MAPPEEPSKAVSSNDFFESIGQQAEQVQQSEAEAQTDGDDTSRVVEEIESLCMECHENGTTRLLLTRIPYFREVILMSFSCDHCGFQNNEIQAAGSVQPRGSHYELRLTDMADFSRQVVKADSATAKFIELDVEIPAGKGQLTNVEGLLSAFVSDLELGQEARKEQHPVLYSQVEEVLAKARAMLGGDAFPFRFGLDDPAGNSWITPDPRDGVGKWEKRDFDRTPEQNKELGLSDTAAAEGSDGAPLDGVPPPQFDDTDDIVPDEVYSFPASCPGCLHPCTTHMKMVDIPHFQQVILISTVCDACGYRSNDVKTGGAVPARGRAVTLRVRAPRDLARDILKSESCALVVPELALSVQPGTLGGRFTTVEGLLTQVRDDLRNQIFQADAAAAAPTPAPAEGGDSLSAGDRDTWTAFFAKVDEAIAGRLEFSIVLTDPLARSYVQSLADDPVQPDAQMTVEEYTRTDEEEEELGLKDMKVEGYETDAKVEDGEAGAKVEDGEAGAS